MTVLAATANAMLDAGLTGTVYLGLLISGGAEVSTSSTGYVRQPVTWAAASSGTKKNSAQVDFPTATAAWGTLAGFGLYTAASGGSTIDTFSTGLSASVVVGTGDQFSVVVGGLTMSVT